MTASPFSKTMNSCGWDSVLLHSPEVCRLAQVVASPNPSKTIVKPKRMDIEEETQYKIHAGKYIECTRDAARAAPKMRLDVGKKESVTTDPPFVRHIESR